MSSELFKEIVDQVSHKVHDLYLFHRGESLLHPRVAEFITYAQTKGIPCKIHTNATRLSASLSKEILTAGLEVLSFSLDGYQAALYEKNRYPAKFEETLENITQFLRLKQEGQKRKPITVLQMMGVRENPPVPELMELVSALKSLGLNRLVFRQPHNWGGAIPLSVESPGEPGRPLFACTFPWYALVVYWNGKVGPCPQDFFARTIVGDINNNTLQEIWNGPEMQTLRETIRDREYQSLPTCRACDRPHRKTFYGVPTEYFRPFLKENLFR